MRKVVLMTKARVSAYTKKDGTFVAAHNDKRSGGNDDPAGYHAFSKKMVSKYGTPWMPSATQDEKQEHERLRLAHNKGDGSNTGRRRAPSEKSETVRLYHESPEAHIQEVRDDGPFRGIFAHSDKGSAVGLSVAGGHHHVMDIPRRNIATREIMSDLSGRKMTLANKTIRESVPAEKLSTKDLNLLRDIVLDEKDNHDLGDDDERRLFAIMREDNHAEISWEMQKIRGQVARALGYQAVEMSDEHGVSHLVLPGVKVLPLSEIRKAVEPRRVLLLKGVRR